MTTVAIDFGTSNTVVSILEPDTQLPKSLRFPNLSRLFIGASAHGERLEIPVIEYWNEKQQKWYKQETIECQPVPKEYQNSKQ